MFISPTCAATQQQREEYDPSGLRGFLLFLMGKNRYYSAWSQYRALSNEFENHWGILDLNSTMSLLRDVYQGRTDFLFFLTQNWRSFKSLHQWVACPETGDILISFSDADNETAFENMVHYFRMSELLEDEPP
jgi:hypothetical protein